MESHSLSGERERDRARPENAMFAMLWPVREPFGLNRRQKAHGGGFYLQQNSTNWVTYKQEAFILTVL